MSLSGSADKTLKLGRLITDRCLRTFVGHTDHVVSVSLSADGRYALSGSDDKTLNLWEVGMGRACGPSRGTQVGWFDFPECGRALRPVGKR